MKKLSLAAWLLTVCVGALIHADEPDPASVRAKEKVLSLLNMRDQAKAISDLSQEIDKNPNDAIALCVRGFAWHRKGEFDKALADLDNSIRIDDSNSYAFHYRAKVLYDKGETEKALSDLNKSISLDKSYAPSFNNRGVIWQDKGEWGKAIDDYSESIRLFPKYVGMALVNRAYLYAGCPDEKYRDGKKALADAENLCEQTRWRSPDAWAALAAAYSSLGDFDSAIKWQTKATEDRGMKAARTAARQMNQHWLDMYKAGKPYRVKSKTDESGPNVKKCPPRSWPQSFSRRMDQLVSAGVRAAQPVAKLRNP